MRDEFVLAQIYRYSSILRRPLLISFFVNKAFATNFPFTVFRLDNYLSLYSASKGGRSEGRSCKVLTVLWIARKILPKYAVLAFLIYAINTCSISDFTP